MNGRRRLVSWSCHERTSKRSCPDDLEPLARAAGRHVEIIRA